MAETTGIAWTDSTFNPWIGCTKVGPGLDNKDVLLAALKAAASNGGDTRCLCSGCLAFWALMHLQSMPTAASSKGTGE